MTVRERIVGSLRRIGAVARKEFRQLRRDRLTAGMIVGIPSIQLILFGYAINLDVRQVPTGVIDRSESALSRKLVGELAGTGVSVQVLCPGMTRTEFQDVAASDTSGLPDFVWQEAEEVVEASLEGLRKGTLVVVPGLKNRVPLAFRGVVGRTLVRKATGFAGRRGWLRSR